MDTQAVSYYHSWLSTMYVAISFVLIYMCYQSYLMGIKVRTS